MRREPADYYARERQILATEPDVGVELRELGVIDVEAEYDGVGDSGRIFGAGELP